MYFIVCAKKTVFAKCLKRLRLNVIQGIRLQILVGVYLQGFVAKSWLLNDLMSLATYKKL